MFYIGIHYITQISAVVNMTACLIIRNSFPGYYVAGSLPSDLTSRSEEDLSKEMMTDLTEGVHGYDVKCGVIGEIGCSWPLHGYYA